MKETKNKKMQFVRTTDESTAEILRNSGYTELTEPSSATYCFINDGKMIFEEGKDIDSKIVYTNMLCI